MDARRTSAPLDTAAKLGVLPLAKAKAHLRLFNTIEDELISGLIVAAFEWLHGPAGYLNGYQLLAEDFTLDCTAPYRARTIELPLRPVIDTSVKVLRQAQDEDAAWLELPAGTARVFVENEVTHVWPSRTILSQYGIRPGSDSLLRVAFRAGHVPSEVPAVIPQAMKLLVAHWYTKREAGQDRSTSTAVSEEVVYGVKSLVGRLRHAADHS